MASTLTVEVSRRKHVFWSVWFTIDRMTAIDDSWRSTHLGRLLGHAMRRFDERVLYLMAHDVEVPLALSNLAARAQVSAAHIHITRHLAVAGSRLTDLAEAAGMSKQAMGDLVDQCEAWAWSPARPTRATAAPAWCASPRAAWPGWRPSGGP